MNVYSCTIWQLLMLGCTWLCGGLSLGITIGRFSRQKEIDELNDRLLLKEAKKQEKLSKTLDEMAEKRGEDE